MGNRIRVLINYNHARQARLQAHSKFMPRGDRRSVILCVRSVWARECTEIVWYVSEASGSLLSEYTIAMYSPNRIAKVYLLQ